MGPSAMKINIGGVELIPVASWRNPSTPGTLNRIRFKVLGRTVVVFNRPGLTFA